MDFLIIPLIVVLGMSNHSSASQAVGSAYLKQSGIEKQLDEFQRRELSESLRARLGEATFLVQTITSQQITYTWRFP
jgi:hypothetical protein